MGVRFRQGSFTGGAHVHVYLFGIIMYYVLYKLINIIYDL